MTTININDELINQVIAKSHCNDANKAVINVLINYLQHTTEQTLFQQLRVEDNVADDELSLLFERDNDAERNIRFSKERLKIALENAVALNIFDGIDGITWQNEQRQDRIIDCEK